MLFSTAQRTASVYQVSAGTSVKPVSVRVDTFGTGTVPDGLLEQAVNRVFDLRPKAIIETLDLRRPIYEQTAKNGHFGNPTFPWERTDRVEALQKAVEELQHA